MATSHIASMLDELMGRNRNFLKGDSNARELKWTDPDVCRYYVVDFCPHDLFTNTKADLGPCGKIHDEEMKRNFHKDKDCYKKSQYYDDFLRFCQRMLADLQNRIKRAKERLLLTQQNEERMLNAGGIGVSGGQNVEADEKFILLSEKIAALVAEAEQAGINGNVEQAQGLMKLCDQLREERDNLRRSVLPANAFKEDYNVQQKAMEVCETCGAFLIVGDAQQRIDDHLLGKQHMGYARLRSGIDRINEERKKAREEREKEVEDRRKQREEEEEKRKNRGSKDSDDERRRKSRERRHRSKSRSRDRKNRSRSRERRRRSRERRRSRSRSRDVRNSERRRSRSRERRERRKSRSKSREKRRKSRSRSRERRKEKETSRSESKDRHERRKSRSKSRDRSKRRSRSRESQTSKVDSAQQNHSSAKKETENNHNDHVDGDSDK